MAQVLSVWAINRWKKNKKQQNKKKFTAWPPKN